MSFLRDTWICRRSSAAAGLSYGNRAGEGPTSVVPVKIPPGLIDAMWPSERLNPIVSEWLSRYSTQPYTLTRRRKTFTGRQGFIGRLA
jgi:hypothetical protein